MFVEIRFLHQWWSIKKKTACVQMSGYKSMIIKLAFLQRSTGKFNDKTF